MGIADTEFVDRIPPQNVEAEQSTLGSMLLDRDAIAKVIETLDPEDFYKETHRIIYEAIVTLFNKSEPVDLITVTEQLRQMGALDNVGGAAYITALANAVPTAANVEHYARIVKEKAILRALVKAGTQIAGLGYSSQGDVEAALDEAEQLIFRISESRSTASIVDIRTVLVQTFDRIEQLYANKASVTGLPTGFADLDEMLSGLQPAELIVIAARPSMGKTALALNIAQHAAMVERVPVLIFSLEMSKEQLAQRMLCAEARVDSQRLRKGDLRSDDWPRLSRALGDLSEAPVYIDDTPTITALDIRARARRLRAEKGLGLIVIDYLQLIQGSGRAENRQQEIAEITRSLKSLARELNIPVIALAQLSRAVETTNEKKPLLSHLKESGEIEQSADVVAFIYREDYYKPDTERKNIAEIIVAKQRNGPTGTVELRWNASITRFENLEKHRMPEPA